MSATGVSLASVDRFQTNFRENFQDFLAVEEPLEIRLDYLHEGSRRQKSISVTMRTPGHDFDLALGFLLTEGLIKHKNEIDDVRYCGPPIAELGHSNIVKISLSSF